MSQQAEALLEQFERIEDEYLRERKADVVQVVERVLKALTGQPRTIPAPRHKEEDSILVAHDLSPADVILFKQHRFASFVTDLGGATSHTAILARSLNIPSIVALHHARALIRESELLIVDGSNGVVIVNPDKYVLAEYQLRQEQWQLERQKLKRLKTTRAATLDGTRIELHANIELPEDVHAGQGERGRRHRPVPQRVPVPQPRRAAVRGRAVRGLPQGGGRDEGPAGDRPHADLGADKHLNGARARRAQPGARAARDPAVPGRAADVPSPAARDSARFALRQDPHPHSDAVHRARAATRPCI